MNDTVSKSGRKPPAQRGSRKGIPNKATANAREAIARFVDGNADRLQGWLDEIAQKQGPRAAFDCFTALLEYHVPKLSRSELTGADGGPIQQNATIDASSLTDEQARALASIPIPPR